jgi:hypothetical protein
MIKPLTVPSTVVNAMAEMIANGHVASRRRRIERAAGHRAEAEIERQDIEEPDARDADDGAFSGGGRVFDRVVANENVRQRRGAGEERDHQRDEVELVDEFG